ncbi:MAG: CPBP family intramembrane glutamic endopeptidase [Cytophagales bacterium]|nr:CPBP family intramembrane glutamic endopeptidase [Cytophagales bacterium]
MIETLLNAIKQVLAFAAIPFIVYLIREKKVAGFLDYIGLKKSSRKANLYALLLMLVLASTMFIAILVDKGFIEVLHDPRSVTGKLRMMGFGTESIFTLLVVASLKTSLSEEIFFRGFVAKRLIAVTNYKTGNIIQAVIFGGIHTLLFLAITQNVLFLVIIFIIPTIGAYVKVHLNEKLADGSIIPGWIAHASANLLAYSLIAFVL